MAGENENLWDAIESPFSADAVEAKSREANAFKQAASEGKVAIDPEYGNHLVTKLDEVLHAHGRHRHVVATLRQAPKLGTSPDGVIVANFHRDAAVGDDRSLESAYTALRQVIIDTQDAVRECMKHYRAADEEARDNLRRIDSDA